MKKILNLFLLLAMATSVLANNDEGKYTKTKNLKKAYAVNPDAGIDIKNAYGNISVVTWSENKVDIDVMIKVSGDNEKWVNSRIDDIDVEFNGMTNLVSAKTVIDGRGSNTRNSHIEINYTIRIPEKGSIKLDNKYGAITVGNIQGNTDIDCQYGRLSLGNLAGKTTLDIQYCNQSNIESVKGASVEANYSKLNIGRFVNVSFDGNYSDFVLGTGNTFTYDSNYSKFNLTSVDNLEGSGNYLNLNIGELEGNLSVSTNYSKINVAKVSAGAGNITIDSGYTNTNITHDRGYGYSLDGEVNYGKLRYDNGAQVNSKEAATRTTVSGSYGNGKNKVRIRSNYGDVKFSS